MPPDILAIQANGAVRGIPEAESQSDNGTLARPAGTDDGDPFARANAQGDAAQYLAFIGVIGELYMVELQRIPSRQVPGWCGQGSGAFHHLGSGISHLEQPLARPY